MNVTSDHWLESAERQPIAGGNLMPVRRFLVIHFTQGASAQSSIDFWNTPAAKGASAHLVIERDGRIIQCRPFNRTCGHAGVSRWRDPKTGLWFSNLNSCSIGIEFANAGDAARENGTAFTRLTLPAGSARAKHKNGGQLTWWEVYPEAQLLAGEQVAQALVKRYNLDDLVGHDDIAPDRKNDPGPLFPMARFRAACGFPGQITR